MIYNITPVPAPRMTQRDKWAKRPCVMRYRAYRDQVASSGMTVFAGDHLIFRLPMPKSWSKKKRCIMNGRPHTDKPDMDNLLKALLDAIFRDLDDSHIWDLRTTKYWAEEGSIEVQENAA